MVQAQIGQAATGKAFEPSPEQREAAVSLSSTGLAHEKIARCIFNLHTGKPIIRTTLYRHFSDELNRGMYDPVCKAIIELFKGMEKGGIARAMAASAILELHQKRRQSELDPEAQVH